MTTEPARRRFVSPTRIVALLATSFLAAPAATAAPSTLDALVERALLANPELAAIDAHVTALGHDAVRARTWRDPVLSVAYQNVPLTAPILGQVGMSMVRVQVGQTIPYFGKTEKRGAVLEKRAETTRWALEERRNQLRAAVKTTWYQLALTRQLKTLTREHITLVDQLIESIRIKYEVGRAAQQNLLRFEVLRDRLTDDLEDFASRETALTASLNATLHRAPTTAVPTPSSFEIALPKQGAEELLALALEARPALRQIEAESTALLSAAELARAEVVPDPTVFAAYGLRTALPGGAQGQDLLTIGLSLPLPFQTDSNQLALARSHESRAAAAQARRVALLDQIASGLVAATATWSRSESKVQRYEKHLVPQAHRTLDATFAAYAVDRASFLALFEAELDLLNFERTIRATYVEGLVAKVTVDLLVGKELP